jgi:ribonuclease BN (tRNA processing enzyme)
VVLVDVGQRSWAKLAQAKIPASQVDTVLLTHLHSDHLGDLGEVAVQSWIGGYEGGARGWRYHARARWAFDLASSGLEGD